ncbi:hypothetical protein [Flavimaricola marinus]|uniref:Uncharacterized protein n=1 Tax=Flavimaricola marinus TaxID=1819565 RepID=A0A238LH63_9RHOB|nr:hypothetical protein [Flavimaricola marinus]SMY08968.1 hypothetical protein LOM8899_03128 [Flavimaricola marinus]
MRNDNRQPAPDFTQAFLVTLGMILFMSFWTIAVVAGFVWVLLSAFAIDRAILIGARLRRG